MTRNKFLVSIGILVLAYLSAAKRARHPKQGQLSGKHLKVCSLWLMLRK